MVPAILSQALAGVTLGKLLLGLRVVSEQNGEPITLRQSVLRELAYFVDAFFFALPAYMSMQDSVRRQRLGDRWAGTMVRFRRDLDPARYSAQTALLAVGAATVVDGCLDLIGLFL